MAALSAARLIFLIGILPGLTVHAAQPTVVSIPSTAGSQEIQQALDQLPEDGGEVVLAPGTYEIKQAIVLRRDHQGLRGSGASTILRLADSANCPVIVLGAPMIEPRPIVSHLHVSDLFIDGNRNHQQCEEWKACKASWVANNGISVETVTDAEIERVSCAHCRSGGLVTANGTRRLVVRDFTTFDNEYDGLACYLTEESIFSRIFSHDNRAAGISLDLSFSHNVISEAVLTGNEHGIFMRDTRGNVFQGLVIRSSREHGVFMAQSGRDTPTGWQALPGTDCTDNSFMGIVISDSGGAAFHPNDPGCTENLICGAQFIHNAKGGITPAGTNTFTISGLVER